MPDKQMTEEEHRKASRKAVVDRFGPKDKNGNYKMWHYQKQGAVWDAMRELEERIKALEGGK